MRAPAVEAACGAGVWARGCTVGRVRLFLMFCRAANAAVLGFDTATGIVPSVASAALDYFRFRLDYG